MSAAPPIPSKSAERRAQQSRSGAFVAGAGRMGETSKLPWPVRLVAELVQYLVALLLLAFAKAVEHTFRRAKKHQRRSAAGGSSAAEPPPSPGHELTAAEVLAQSKKAS